MVAKNRARLIKALVVSGGVTDVGKTMISKHMVSLLRDVGREAIHIGTKRMHEELDDKDREIDVDFDGIYAFALEQLVTRRDIVLDVCGESFRHFANTMLEFGNGIFRRFTHIIVPITDGVKSEIIVSAIEYLVNHDAPAKNIYLVFNNTNPSSSWADISRAYSWVIEKTKEMDVNVVEVPLMHSGLIAKKRGHKTVFDINTDVDTLKAKVAKAVSAGDLDGAQLFAYKVIEAEMALIATANIKAVFCSIFEV